MALASTIHQLIEAPVPVRCDPRQVAGKAASYGEPGEITPYVAKFDLSQSLLEANQMKRPRRFVDVLIAVVFHVVVLGTPIFLSLWFTNTLNLKAYTQTMLVGPPPPPPPPPAPSVVKAAAPRHVFFEKGKLLAPSYVPRQVAMLKEAPLPDANAFGVEGGVPGWRSRWSDGRSHGRRPWWAFYRCAGCANYPQVESSHSRRRPRSGAPRALYSCAQVPSSRQDFEGPGNCGHLRDS